MTESVRSLVRADLEWVLDLTAARRVRLAPFAPRFWNPAPDARAVHADFLGGLIDSPEVLSVRTGHGFLFGLPRDGLVLVDDLALSADQYWRTEGDALLRRAERDGPLRVVCPVPEAARRAAATTLGLSVVETWWHRDLDADLGEDAQDRRSDDTSPGDDATMRVPSAEGRLVPAPPVYAPGGPVLLIGSVESDAGLRELERAAARRGVPVCVVTLGPGDQVGTELVERAGYRRTTDFLQ